MAAYRTLLNVSVEHGFFSGGACRCLNFRATEGTRRLLDNAGLLQRQTADGIQLIVDQDRLEALKLYAQDKREPFCLAFKVYSTDPHFQSYTEPFADIADRMLCLDNRAVAPARGRMRLSALETVSDKDCMRSDAPELRHVITHRDRLLPPLFVLRIFAETDRGSHLARWLESEPPTYTIAFDARRTFWKYYLLGKLAVADSYIHDADKRIEFDALGEALLPGHRPAFTFRSKQAIPLHEQYGYRFQLKQQGPGGETVLINRLPVACITQTGKDVVAERKTTVSEIYINS